MRDFLDEQSEHSYIGPWGYWYWASKSAHLFMGWATTIHQLGSQRSAV